MATQEDVAGENLEKMNENLARVEELTQRLIQAFSSRNPANPSLNGPDQELFAKAASSLWADMLENPGKIYEKQLEYWGKSVRHFMEAQQGLMQGHLPEADEYEEDPLNGDKRFANPLWETNPYFHYVKQQYALNKRAIEDAVAEADGLSPKDKQRLEYF